MCLLSRLSVKSNSTRLSSSSNPAQDNIYSVHTPWVCYTQQVIISGSNTLSNSIHYQWYCRGVVNHYLTYRVLLVRVSTPGRRRHKEYYGEVYLNVLPYQWSHTEYCGVRTSSTVITSIMHCMTCTLNFATKPHFTTGNFFF